MWEYFYDSESVQILCSNTPISGSISTLENPLNIPIVDGSTDQYPEAYLFEGNVYGFREPANPRWRDLEE